MADLVEGNFALERARAMVVADPKVVGGQPVIRGTRIPVHDVAASAAAGLPLSRILAAYPGLTAEQVELAKLYASAEPEPSRPYRVGDGVLPAGARVVSRRRVLRQARGESSVQ